MKLVDSGGREYDKSSKGIFLYNSFDMLKNVNPGVSSGGIWYAVVGANHVFAPPGATWAT